MQSVEEPAAHRTVGVVQAPRQQPAQADPLPPDAVLYGDAFGWPISIEAGKVTVTCGDVLDVTTMPSQFAREVHNLLGLALLNAPILELAATAVKPSMWAFLSNPRLPTTTDGPLVKLSLFDVEHFGAGQRFPLPPSPTSRSDDMAWVVPPSFGDPNKALPPWESILACAAKVKYIRSASRKSC